MGLILPVLRYLACFDSGIVILTVSLFGNWNQCGIYDLATLDLVVCRVRVRPKLLFDDGSQNPKVLAIPSDEYLSTLILNDDLILRLYFGIDRGALKFLQSDVEIS